jgi:hypothetical protein
MVAGIWDEEVGRRDEDPLPTVTWIASIEEIGIVAYEVREVLPWKVVVNAVAVTPADGVRIAAVDALLGKLYTKDRLEVLIP